MSKITKLGAPLLLIAALAACQPNPTVNNAAAGAALGAAAGYIVGGSRTDVAAGAAVGAIAGSAVPVQ